MKIYCSQQPELNKAQWYLKPFMLYTFKDRGLEIGFTVPFKVFGKWIWYIIPNWLMDRQVSECKNYIPDYNRADGTKVKPLFGWVIDSDENAELNWKWWKHLKRYKVNPKMLEFENRNNL